MVTNGSERPLPRLRRLRRIRGFATPALVLALTMFCGKRPLGAADVKWTGDDPVSDAWSSALNWKGGPPPSVGDHAIIGPPAPAVLDLDRTIDSLEIDAGLLNILGGKTLTLAAGDLRNDGEIVVNSDNAALLSRLVFPAGGAIAGVGTLTLNRVYSAGFPPAIPVSGARLEAASSLTNGANHTIRGMGRIDAALVNNGMVAAYNPIGSGSLRLILSATTNLNNGTFAAGPGSILEIQSLSVQQGGGGIIQADGGTVQLNGLHLHGGELRTTGTGNVVIQSGGGGARFHGVTNNGALTANATLVLDGGGFANNGTVALSTSLQVDGTMTVAGTGAVVGTSSVSSTISTLGSSVLTNGAGHALRGKLQIFANLVNDGVIEAAITGTSTSLLTLTGQNKVNNNRIAALAGNTLDIVNNVVVVQDHAAGIIVADEGTIRLRDSVEIVDGRLHSTGPGRIQASGSAKLTDVTNQGLLEVLSSGVTVRGSGLTNDGLIRVNPTFANTTIRLLFDGATAMTLDGVGEIELVNVGFRAQVSVAAGKTLTNAPGHTIRGLGEINGSLVNRGTVSGPGGGNVLAVNGPLAGDGPLRDMRINDVHRPGFAPYNAVPVHGLYQLAPTATLEIEIGGAHPNNYDRVLSQADVQLGGTLAVAQVDFGGGLFVPQIGDQFEIISGASVTGTFANMTFAGLPSALTYAVLYAPTAVTLEARPALDADFNLDGRVDGADFLIWQRGYGTTGGAAHAQGDADRNGVVDSADLAIWQATLGASVPAVVVSGAVPEPATIGLLVMAAAAAWRGDRRGR